MTSTKAGMTPAKSPDRPSSRRIWKKTPKVEAFLGGALLGPPGSVSCDLGAVMRVLTTHIGFVIKTVRLPATAPAAMDSIAVSFLDARPDLMAAFSKNE